MITLTLGVERDTCAAYSHCYTLTLYDSLLLSHSHPSHLTTLNLPCPVFIFVPQHHTPNSHISQPPIYRFGMLAEKCCRLFQNTFSFCWCPSTNSPKFLKIKMTKNFSRNKHIGQQIQKSCIQQLDWNFYVEVSQNTADKLSSTGIITRDAMPATPHFIFKVSRPHNTHTQWLTHYHWTSTSNTILHLHYSTITPHPYSLLPRTKTTTTTTPSTHYSHHHHHCTHYHSTPSPLPIPCPLTTPLPPTLHSPSLTL